MAQARESGEAADPQGWREEGHSLLRAIAGGSLVGIPLLYTMEMWQHGMSLGEWHLLLILAATLLLNSAFCFISGFRKKTSFWDAVSESITAVGVAIGYSALVLLLVGELYDSSWPDKIGKIILNASVVSIGIAFANSQMEGDAGGDDAEREKDKSGEEKESASKQQIQADLREFAAAAAGSTVFALNVAPTEEIMLIASRLSSWNLLAVLFFSTLLCYVILFAAGFRQTEVHETGIFQHPVAETILTSAISLTVAALLLFLLGERELLTNPATAVASVVTLGLPAIVGGAAGRLVA